MHEREIYLQNTAQLPFTAPSLFEQKKYYKPTHFIHASAIKRNTHTRGEKFHNFQQQRRKKKIKTKKKSYTAKSPMNIRIYTKKIHRSNNTQQLHQSTSQSTSALACIHVYFVYMHTCSNTNNLVRSTGEFVASHEKEIYL